MKEFEMIAYIKAIVVQNFLAEAKTKLGNEKPEDWKNSANSLKKLVENALGELNRDELLPKGNLTEKEFQDHILSIIKKVRKNVEKQLESIAEK